MSVEALSIMVAKAVAPVLIGRLAGTAFPQERVSRWVGRDPARLALREALREALTEFESRHPLASESLFDDVFLTSPAVCLLACRRNHPASQVCTSIIADQRGTEMPRFAARFL
jgi:hypothetical protein